MSLLGPRPISRRSRSAGPRSRPGAEAELDRAGAALAGGGDEDARSLLGAARTSGVASACGKLGDPISSSPSATRTRLTGSLTPAVLNALTAVRKAISGPFWLTAPRPTIALFSPGRSTIRASSGGEVHWPGRTCLTSYMATPSDRSAGIERREHRWNALGRDDRRPLEAGVEREAAHMVGALGMVDPHVGDGRKRDPLAQPLDRWLSSARIAPTTGAGARQRWAGGEQDRGRGRRGKQVCAFGPPKMCRHGAAKRRARPDANRQRTAAAAKAMRPLVIPLFLGLPAASSARSPRPPSMSRYPGQGRLGRGRRGHDEPVGGRRKARPRPARPRRAAAKANLDRRTIAVG